METGHRQALFLPSKISSCILVPAGGQSLADVKSASACSGSLEANGLGGALLLAWVGCSCLPAAVTAAAELGQTASTAQLLSRPSALFLWQAQQQQHLPGWTAVTRSCTRKRGYQRRSRNCSYCSELGLFTLLSCWSKKADFFTSLQCKS